MSKAQALQRPEFEDFNYEQLKEIAEHKTKSLSSSPTMESQITPLIDEPVNESSLSSVSRSPLTSCYF